MRELRPFRQCPTSASPMLYVRLGPLKTTFPSPNSPIEYLSPFQTKLAVPSDSISSDFSKCCSMILDDRSEYSPYGDGDGDGLERRDGRGGEG